MTAGVEYFIMIDGYGAAAGAYQMDITTFEPCVITFPALEPGILYENEPPLVDGDLDTHNGGCNSPEFSDPFQQITSPVFCGVSGWYIGPDGYDTRDSDWFHIVIRASGSLEIHGDAEYPTWLQELPVHDCNTPVTGEVGIAGPCTDASMTITGAPGSLVWFWVGPTTFTGPVNEYNYILHLNLEEPVPTETHSWTSVKSLFH